MVDTKVIYDRNFRIETSRLKESLTKVKNRDIKLQGERFCANCFRFQLIAKYSFNTMSVIGYDVG
jgi:hypothetical protein